MFAQVEAVRQGAGIGLLPNFMVAPIDDPSRIPTLEEAERMLIELTLTVTKGHKGKTCQILGISRPTLERKLQKYGVRQDSQA